MTTPQLPIVIENTDPRYQQHRSVITPITEGLHMFDDTRIYLQHVTAGYEPANSINFQDRLGRWTEECWRVTFNRRGHPYTRRFRYKSDARRYFREITR